jgi:hypothetical protein
LAGVLVRRPQQRGQDPRPAGPRSRHELNGTARQEHAADIVGIVTNRTLSDAAQRFVIKHRIHVIDRPS